MNQTERTQHTPAPWNLTQVGKSGFHIGTPERLIAELHLWGKEDWGSSVAPPPEVTANARLIAAAPDLLAALEAALPELASDARHDDSVKDIHAQVVAAIAKARGQ